ncbi:hypothetical protein OIU78_003214 [Salix suchowensis]|nr:hypothetical protein OIU78_003214 [Salix suchowensis]
MIALSPASQCSKLAGGANPIFEDIRDGEEIVKRRRVSEVKEDSENAQSGDEYFTATPAVVSLGPGVKIISVAAGGRHTLALSGKSKLIFCCVTKAFSLVNHMLSLLFVVTC